MRMLIFKNNSVASIMVGDCLASLMTLHDRSVNSCVTSPPYYGLRDYGNAGQIGLEESPDAYVAKLVAVFREVRRVLTDDGTLWLNIGDSYSRAPVRMGGEGIKAKDLIGIPWMLAFALRADGWYLRQDIVWNKPNPMPESVTDRCTKAHEYVFLLSKSDRYFYDHEAVKEPVLHPKITHKSNKKSVEQNAAFFGNAPSNLGRCGTSENGMRNKRSVWTVAPKPYSGAHFAVYPPELIEPCILAGCPEGGVVLDPFGGSGTTAGVALKHGRNAILCELNANYAALMPARIESIAC